MKDPRPLHRAAALAARRPALVLALTVVLALAALACATRLAPDAGIDTLVGTDGPSYAATQTYRERFGDDPIIVLVRGSLNKLLLSQDLERVLGLEGCMAGNIPPGTTPRGGADGPCGRLARTKPVKVVFGPGTFIAEAARQLGTGFARRVQQNAARATAAARQARSAARRQGLSPAAAERAAARARARVESAFQGEVVELAVRYGLRAIPRIDDPNFVSTLVFDPAKPAGTPKRKFAYLFPSKGGGPGQAALIQVRLRAGLGEAQRAAALRHIRAAVAMKEWKPANGATYTVTGAPVVVADLTASISGSMWVLLVAALLVMALTLAVVFRGRPRLLALGIALAATALTFGALALAGRVADDGVDRGAAGAHRPRGRLCDPAAGAHRGGGPRRRPADGVRRAARRAARRAGRGRRGSRHRRRLRGAHALAGADGARLRDPARRRHRDRLRLRAVRRYRGARAGRAGGRAHAAGAAAGPPPAGGWGRLARGSPAARPDVASAAGARPRSPRPSPGPGACWRSP